MLNARVMLYYMWGGTVLLSSETGVEGPGRIQNFKPFPNAMVRCVTQLNGHDNK